jgi:hypothetical protein
MELIYVFFEFSHGCFDRPFPTVNLGFIDIGLLFFEEVLKKWEIIQKRKMGP